jgi:hypothetical protein
MACAASGPVVVGPIVVDRLTKALGHGPDGPVARGWWAKIDLADPRTEVVVTDAPSAGPGENRPADATPPEAALVATDRWAKDRGTVVAINANFFALLKPRGALDKAVSPDSGYRGGAAADIIGLSVAGGRVVSPGRVVGGRGDPCLMVLSDGSAVVSASPMGLTAGAEALLTGEGLPAGKVAPVSIVAAVAGIGPSETEKGVPGTLLVTDGANTGSKARVDPTKRHPRTAAGVSKDGRTLVLLVVDGRSPGHSVGMTLAELADTMINLGVDDAVNLDGGGSTAFVFDPAAAGATGERVTNKPSDGKFRPVANHLGVRVRAAPAAGGGKEGGPRSDE